MVRPYAERVSEQVTDRVARGLAVAALTVPSMVVAHLATAGTAPSPIALAAVAVLVAGVGALCLDRSAVTPRGVSAAVIGLVQLTGHAVFSAATASGEGCLPVVGRGAQVGLRLALLRPAPECPPGTLGLTQAAATTTSVLLAAALVLLAHAATGGLGTALVLGAERGWSLARRLGWAARPSLTLLVSLAGYQAPTTVRAPRRESYLFEPSRLFARWVGVVGARRGPPALPV